MPLPHRLTIGLISAVIIIVATLTGSVQKLLAAPSPPKCDGRSPSAIHQIAIHNNRPSLARVRGLVCDQLTITNLDATGRTMVFNTAGRTVSYDAITRQPLVGGASFTFTFTQSGTFKLADQLHPGLQITFIVTAAP